MGSQIDIENTEKLKTLWTFLMNRRDSGHINKVLPVFPFGQLQDVTKKENIQYVLRILTMFLDIDKFMSDATNINLCMEFVFTNLVTLNNVAEDEILKDFLDYFFELLSRLRYVLVLLNLNVDPERICLLINDISKKSECKSRCIQIFIALFDCNDIYFQINEIYDRCVNEFYTDWMKFDFLDLCKLGSRIVSVPSLRHSISVMNTFYHWIECICPNVLHIVSDELAIYEFVKCLSLVYFVKGSNDFRLTNAYRHRLNIFENYLKVAEIRDNTLVIFRYILNDLSSQEILPPVNDFCENVLELKNTFFENKDFVIVRAYLKVIFVHDSIDENELFKCMARICISTDTFYLVTLKAMCYLYPKYVKNREQTNVTGDIILNALLNSNVNFERVLSYDTDQLKWILRSEKTALKYVTVRSWLGKFKNDNKLLTILRETENLQILVQLLMTEKMYDISKRAANLLRMANDPLISRFLIRKIPEAIISPLTLANLLHAKPSIPYNRKEAEFFCKVMGTILPEVLNSEAFIGVCFYSTKLLHEMRGSPDAIRHFCENYRTVHALQRAGSSKNEDVSMAGITLLATLFKLQDRLDIKAKTTLELDFTKLLKGSANLMSKGLLLLQTVLKMNMAQPLIKLPENDILAQFLFVQEIEVEEIKKQILSTMILFMKRYHFLKHFCATAIFVTRQLRNPPRDFINFLQFLLGDIEKGNFRVYSEINLKSFLSKQKEEQKEF